jgi:hypothetical protein
VDAAYLRTLLRESLWVCGVFVGFAIGLGFFCGAALQVVVFSGLAAFVEQGIEPSYRFDQLFCFGVLALTPAAIAAMIYAAFGVSFDNLLLVYLLAFAFYFTGGTTACRHLLLPPGARLDEED